ncbi:hypothetical protein CDL15_Pgr014767 [Punica granatum]|nr:hypothetical protein CDL15_Pgr014767 [Punica granatum]PKI78047.1 hypothetical protein CRG98_001667 [Punica granatum]
MGEERQENNLEVRAKIIKKAFHYAMKAHKNPEKPFVIRKRCLSSNVIFAFPGTWSTADWIPTETSTRHFGQAKVNLEVFPSLRSIGNDEAASVHDAFLRRFLLIVEKPKFQNEVEKALKRKKQIIFAGHSGGGPVAIYATVWLFEYLRSKKIQASSPFCLTFGSPLMADHIFGHAVRREKWSDCFIHFITRYDIIPRIMLAPPSYTEQILPEILPFFSKNSQNSTQTSLENDEFVTVVFENVMRNASSVASQAACKLMGSTNYLVDTISSFVELSPYRPFGTYVFCYGNKKVLTVRNPDAVLQLLIYSSQLSSRDEGSEVAQMSLSEHLAYKTKLDEIAGNQEIYCLDKFRELPLNSEECADSEAQTINTALNELGLSVRARLCLRAAREAENHKIANQKKIDTNRDNMEKAMTVLEGYRTSCETRRVGYYDSFKLQKYQEDFMANIKRLELAGMWDEIIEMLKRYELPDGFEGEDSWVELGTKYRRLVEPFDIANYYRNSLNADTQLYMKPGSRPKRYWYTQRWREHKENIPRGSSGESTFWADVEQLRIEMIANKTPFNSEKEKVLELEENLKAWYDATLVKKDVFLPETTLVKWWKTLPEQHRASSCIKELISS